MRLDPGDQLGGDGQKRKWKRVLGYLRKVSFQPRGDQVRCTEMNKEAREGKRGRTEMSSQKAGTLEEPRISSAVTSALTSGEKPAGRSCAD